MLQGPWSQKISSGPSVFIPVDEQTPVSAAVCVSWARLHRDVNAETDLCGVLAETNLFLAKAD